MVFKPFSSLCNTLILNKIIFNILTKSHRFIHLIFRSSEKHPSNAHSQYLFSIFFRMFYPKPAKPSKPIRHIQIQSHSNKNRPERLPACFFEIVCNSIKPLFAFGTGFKALVQPEILFGIFPCPRFDKIVHALGVGCNVV